MEDSPSGKVSPKKDISTWQPADKPRKAVTPFESAYMQQKPALAKQPKNSCCWFVHLCTVNRSI